MKNSSRPFKYNFCMSVSRNVAFIAQEYNHSRLCFSESQIPYKKQDAGCLAWRTSIKNGVLARVLLLLPNQSSDSGRIPHLFFDGSGVRGACSSLSTHSSFHILVICLCSFYGKRSSSTTVCLKVHWNTTDPCDLLSQKETIFQNECITLMQKRTFLANMALRPWQGPCFFWREREQWRLGTAAMFHFFGEFDQMFGPHKEISLSAVVAIGAQPKCPTGERGPQNCVDVTKCRS